MDIIFTIFLAVATLGLVINAQNPIPADLDPCLDPGYNADQWTADNTIQPNYIPATTENKPSALNDLIPVIYKCSEGSHLTKPITVVARRIFDEPRTSETGQSYSIDLAQTSVIYITGVIVELLQANILKSGPPEDLPRSLGTGYNSAILAVRLDAQDDASLV